MVSYEMSVCEGAGSLCSSEVGGKGGRRRSGFGVGGRSGWEATVGGGYEVLVNPIGGDFGEFGPGGGGVAEDGGGRPC